jgi:hypothetical protein
MGGGTTGKTSGTSTLAAVPIPTPGSVVQVRSRAYLVESVDLGSEPSSCTRVRLSCLEDDAQGEPLEVLWELELDAQIIDQEAWKKIGEKGFDEPQMFAAYFNTLRWNCVTSTDPRLLQAPFRAGIKLDAYQLEPLRKALELPRVNLLIADDVGLGKTIEAGLIARELLLRKRVREIVVACPPSMLTQWKEELEQRFGLVFEIFDKAYVQRVREQHGWGVNPWTTFPRFLISHRLLIDDFYTAPMVAWMESLRPGTLFIFDEAHHAAPSSGSKYAIDTRITGAIRDIAPRFEHRLFLSATPHNGHSNSFSALLEILDDKRFVRGTKIRKADLDAVMVRRLKEDLRLIVKGFAVRNVDAIEIDDLPQDAPELKLAELLERYRQAREKRFEGATRGERARGMLIACNRNCASSCAATTWRTSHGGCRCARRSAASRATRPAATSSTAARSPARSRCRSMAARSMRCSRSAEAICAPPTSSRARLSSSLTSRTTTYASRCTSPMPASSCGREHHRTSDRARRSARG